MKGFVITIDGIIGLILFLSLFVMINSPAMRVAQSAWADTQMRSVAMDSLVILEKNEMLSRAVQTNSSSELVYFMSTELSSVCVRISIEGDNYFLSAAKPGCEERKGGFMMARRSFVCNGSFYIAELDVWSR